MKMYREIVRNADMGIQAIDNIICYVDCDKLKNSLLAQKEVLEDFHTRGKMELSKEEQAEAQSSKMQKSLLKTSVALNAMFDHSTSHIASMLIDGYNMGITSVQKVVNEMENNSVEVPLMSKDFMKAYDKNIKTLRAYL